MEDSEMQGREEEEDFEITRVVTRDARGIDSQGSARDSSRVINFATAAIGRA